MNALEKLRELERAATSGPWRIADGTLADLKSIVVDAPAPPAPPDGDWIVADILDPSDASLIAALRNAAPALLAIADAYEAQHPDCYLVRALSEALGGEHE